jgi:hypothetical protein
VGDYIVDQIVRGTGILCIRFQPADQQILREQKNAHGNKLSGCLSVTTPQASDPSFRVNLQGDLTPGASDSSRRDPDGEICARLAMLRDEHAKVHAVDRTPIQEEHLAGPVQEVAVLVDRIRCPPVPVHALPGLIGTQQGQSASIAIQVPRPAKRQVFVQGTWLMLSDDPD